MAGFQIHGDLQLSENERYLVFWQGSEAVTDLIRTRLQTLQGSRYYDQASGMRYFDEILSKPSDGALPLLRAEVYRTVAATPGVQSVSRVDVEFDPDTRVASIEFECQTDSGVIQDRLEIS